MIAVIQGTDKDTSEIHKHTHEHSHLLPSPPNEVQQHIEHAQTQSLTHPTQHHQSHALLINEENVHLD